jgi:hypothetical protein
MGRATVSSSPTAPPDSVDSNAAAPRARGELPAVVCATHAAVSRTIANLEPLRWLRITMANCRRCNATMTEKECDQSVSALALHARAQTDTAETDLQLEWVQSQMPLCVECVNDMIQEHLRLPPRNRARPIEPNAEPSARKRPRSSSDE